MSNCTRIGSTVGQWTIGIDVIRDFSTLALNVSSGHERKKQSIDYSRKFNKFTFNNLTLKRIVTSRGVYEKRIDCNNS